MELVKIIFLIAITMALSTTLTMKTMVMKIEEGATKMNTNDIVHNHELEEVPHVLLPSKRARSRFLAENEKERNPRAADHCHKDREVCYTLAGGKNSTCCNNKCVDLRTDHHNCGRCKKKCMYTQACCRGECVYVSFDKRHCGECNHRCAHGKYCIYGMCSYA